MERSADVLAAGLLDVSDPSLSSKYFLRQVDIFLKHHLDTVCGNVLHIFLQMLILYVRFFSDLDG